ncbi:hypothetical protein [Vibrio harveyi]|uniref:hypothetical protein n=2 Tax=Vibrio harveyi TaxID=669 RepID=UPI00165D62DA|nr:hypothetical protein [Vibrio harveyi]
MLALKYLSDESVHSWILRNLIVSGSLSFSSVIGKNGQWIAEPQFTRQCHIELDEFDDVDLLIFLRKSGIAIKTAGEFDNPIDHLLCVDRIFKHHTYGNSVKGRLFIRYCPLCIKVSIEDFGFAYFKSAWLYSVRCNHHNINLIQIKAVTYNEALDSLNSIMSARPLEINRIESPTQYMTLKKSYNKEGYFHIMPCLLDDFYWWASRIRKDDYLEFSHTIFYKNNGVRKELSNERVQYFFEKYREDLPSQFFDFLLDRVEIKNFRFGISQPYSLSERILKSERHNCSKCMFLSEDCILDSIIQTFYLGESKVSSSKVNNICEKLFFR